MSCKLKNIGPVNLIPNTNGGFKECDNNKCKLIYNFGLSRCGLTNKGTYLKIKTDGNNTLKFGNLGNLTISETRLYKPSLNKISGVGFDAEIIIHCIAEDSSNFVICIPVETNDNGGTSNDWFSFLINCQSEIDSSINVNKNNFTMNDLLPKGSFFYCEDLSMPWICNNEDKMIIFQKAATMDGKIKNTLETVLKSHSYVARPLTGRTTVYVNSSGTASNISADSGGSMTCVPISNSTGKPLIAPGQNSGFVFKNKLGEDIDTAKLQKKSEDQWLKMLSMIYTALAVIGICLLILLILYIANQMTVRAKLKGSIKASSTS